MIQVTLYTTEGCHLCELAVELLTAITPPVEINAVEIGDDDDLVEQYGVRIPVVEFASGKQLNWPFNTQQIIDAL